MSGELVPQELPYGERQKTEAGMALAGAPTSLAVPQGLPPALPPAGVGSGSVGFDPLTELQPMEQPSEFVQPTREQRVQEAMLSSVNPVLREAARRILGVQ